MFDTSRCIIVHILHAPVFCACPARWLQLILSCTEACTVHSVLQTRRPIYARWKTPSVSHLSSSFQNISLLLHSIIVIGAFPHVRLTSLFCEPEELPGCLTFYPQIYLNVALSCTFHCEQSCSKDMMAASDIQIWHFTWMSSQTSGA